MDWTGRRSSHLSVATSLALGVAALLVATPAHAACDLAGASAPAVAAARAAVADGCDCAGAPDRASYRDCVLATLAPLVADGRLPAACLRRVRDLEMRSTCGRPGRIACCRTRASGKTTALLATPAHCTAPLGGSACVSPWAQLLDACTDDGCRPLPACGDGVVERGEVCDPPDGTSCDARCRRVTCATESDNVLLACTSSPPEVAVTALPGGFLFVYSELSSSQTTHVVARRLDATAQIVEPAPLVVSNDVAAPLATSSFGPSVTQNGSSYYVAWETALGLPAYEFRGRIVPATGAITSTVDTIAAFYVVGQCGTYLAGPLGLAPTLDSMAIHATLRQVFYCYPGGVLFENLVGLVPGFFNVPPPGNVSTGVAPLARGASDVAGAWWNIAVPSLTPPITTISTVHAAWIEPGPRTAFPLTTTAPATSPSLAAVGDTFLAVWAARAVAEDPFPSEVRAMRFSRAAGALDPDGGALLASNAGGLGGPLVAADGTNFVVVWQELQAAPASHIRALHVAPDGTVLDLEPVDVAPTSAGALGAVAASASTAIAVLTRTEPDGSMSARAYAIAE